MNRKPPHVIDLTLDEPSRMSPALSQIDRLLKQSLLETQSLQVVRHLLLQEQMGKAQTNGHGKLLAAATLRQEQQSEEALPPKTKRRKLRDGRKPPAERIEAIRRYLEQHPGADTQEIAAGLGWRPALVAKFVASIATPQKAGRRKPMRWFLKGSSKPQQAKQRAKPVQVDRKPREQQQELIRTFLGKHPEAYTKDVAKALKRKPNSNFVSLMREVARPLRETKATQPIQWVLTP